MDDNAPQFSSENILYRNQIMQDLPVAILKDGQWGSYRTLTHEEDSKGAKLADLQIGDYKCGFEIIYVRIDIFNIYQRRLIHFVNISD